MAGRLEETRNVSNDGKNLSTYSQLFRAERETPCKWKTQFLENVGKYVLFKRVGFGVKRKMHKEDTHSFSEKNKYSLLTCALQRPLWLTIDFYWKTLWSSSKRAHVDHEYAAHNPCGESFGGNAGAPFRSATIFQEQDEESIPIVHPRRTNDGQLFILRHEKL